MENWPITVTQSPPGSEAEFNQDIVVRFKASERGAAAVINPALRREEHRGRQRQRTMNRRLGSGRLGVDRVRGLSTKEEKAES